MLEYDLKRILTSSHENNFVKTAIRRKVMSIFTLKEKLNLKGSEKFKFRYNLMFASKKMTIKIKL